MSVEDKIIASILTIAKIHTGKSIVNIDEVDALYESGKYPELNASIDYVLKG